MLIMLAFVMRDSQEMIVQLLYLFALITALVVGCAMVIHQFALAVLASLALTVQLRTLLVIMIPNAESEVFAKAMCVHVDMDCGDHIAPKVAHLVAPTMGFVAKDFAIVIKDILDSIAQAPSRQPSSTLHLLGNHL